MIFIVFLRRAKATDFTIFLLITEKVAEEIATRNVREK